MKLAVVVLMIGSVCAWSQKPCAGGAPPKNAPDCVPMLTAGPGVTLTLQKNGDVKVTAKTCEKYQHWQHAPEHCANTCSPEATLCTSQCLYVPAEDKCVDDIHVVTEREWQELKEWREFLDQLRAQQCPTLSWINGKCMPWCDEIDTFGWGAIGSCTYRPKDEKAK
jgi:hypothetical protein